MKKMFEGATALSVVFFLIIVAGGFIFGKTMHKEKSNQRKNTEKQISKVIREKDEIYKKNNKEKEEELEYIQKMNDPLWYYFDGETLQYKPIPGKYNVDIPIQPKKNNIY